MIIALLVILGALATLIIGATLRSNAANKAANNTIFLQGTMPEPLLDGLYNGNTAIRSNWLGKRFYADKNRGLNRFSDGERYEFATGSAKSLSSNNKVLKLDYNQPGNPWWLKLIVDEVSQVEPGKYQGKVYIKVGPTFFTLTYFELTSD